MDKDAKKSRVVVQNSAGRRALTTRIWTTIHLVPSLEAEIISYASRALNWTSSKKRGRRCNSEP